MPIGKLRYCWDSCVFISLLTGSGRTQEELDNLRKLEALVDAGAVTVFTPSITRIEVLSCKLTVEQEESFQDLLQRPNVQSVSVTNRIADKAREMRNHYRQMGLEIAVPDSIHLATALHYSATALHTFDGCGKRQRTTDLLKLSLPLLGKYPMTICKPTPPPPDKEEGPIGDKTGSLFEGLEEQFGLPEDEMEAEKEKG